MNHLYDRLTKRAVPGRLLLEADGGRRFTYGDLVEISGRMANALRALGVKVGDRVLAQAEKSPEMIFLYLACLRAGAVFLPLNTSYTKAEAGYFVADAKPALLIGGTAQADALRALAQEHGGRVETLGVAGDGSFVDVARALPAAFANAARGPDDLAAILYTSGTTGRSKGAMMSHDNLGSNALTLRDLWRFTDKDTLIHALPIYHTHGLFVACNVVLMAGATMLFQHKFDADAVLAAMPRATALMGVPTFYTRLVDHPGLTREAARDMRLFISGSAPLLAATHDAFKHKTGHAILERYGMTETNMITSNPYDGERIAGTVGFPLPGVSLRIAQAETGAPLPQGETGVIEITGPNVFKGYWNMPEKTASEFRADGWFITGDLGRFDENGYLQIVGRAKDLIISGGLNVYPKEIEAELDALPGIVESAVFGVPHADFGEAVAAAVVCEAGLPADESVMISALAQRLAKFKLPKRIHVVAELPRNAMGKVQKNALRKKFGGGLGE
jgi:malonyl-CoA/methylmalonyl-CoA synthetase